MQMLEASPEQLNDFSALKTKVLRLRGMKQSRVKTG